MSRATGNLTRQDKAYHAKQQGSTGDRGGVLYWKQNSKTTLKIMNVNEGHISFHWDINLQNF